LNKHRICTTISHKHWELLQNYAEKYGTQQKALEVALEGLKANSKPSMELSSDEKLSIHIIRSKSVCLVRIDWLKMLMETTDSEHLQEYVNLHKPLQYVLEHYYLKPLKECNLREVIDGLIINARVSNFFDTISCTENNNHYLLVKTHRMGLNQSKQLKIALESVLNTYGVKTECTITDGAVFMRIYKKGVT
jgi:hypothetical protein